MRQKRVHGFATGDMVKAVVPSGRRPEFTKAAWPCAYGSFAIQKADGKVDGIHWRHCRLISHNDGYGYAWLRPALIPPSSEDEGFLRDFYEGAAA